MERTDGRSKKGMKDLFHDETNRRRSLARSLPSSAERIRGTQFSTHHLTSVHHRRRRRRRVTDGGEPPSPSERRAPRGRSPAAASSAGIVAGLGGRLPAATPPPHNCSRSGARWAGQGRAGRGPRERRAGENRGRSPLSRFSFLDILEAGNRECWLKF